MYRGGIGEFRLHVADHLPGVFAGAHHDGAADDLAAADTNPVPQFLREEGYQYLGSEPIAASRYVSADFFKLECEKMWPNVWQFAAREEELPDPGDFVVYENAGRSYLLIRQADGSVRIPAALRPYLGGVDSFHPVR